MCHGDNRCLFQKRLLGRTVGSRRSKSPPSIKCEVVIVSVEGEKRVSYQLGLETDMSGRYIYEEGVRSK